MTRNTDANANAVVNEGMLPANLQMKDKRQGKATPGGRALPITAKLNRNTSKENQSLDGIAKRETAYPFLAADMAISALDGAVLPRNPTRSKPSSSPSESVLSLRTFLLGLPTMVMRGGLPSALARGWQA